MALGPCRGKRCVTYPPDYRSITGSSIDKRYAYNYTVIRQPVLVHQGMSSHSCIHSCTREIVLPFRIVLSIFHNQFHQWNYYYNFFGGGKSVERIVKELTYEYERHLFTKSYTIVKTLHENLYDPREDSVLFKNCITNGKIFYKARLSVQKYGTDYLMKITKTLIYWGLFHTKKLIRLFKYVIKIYHLTRITKIFLIDFSLFLCGNRHPIFSLTCGF